MSPIISLSTSYLQDRFKHDGYAMLCKAAEMGFEYVELGHSTTVQSVEGIQKALEENIIKVSSVHNFCPIPPFAKGACPNLFSPATRSKSESKQWLMHTQKTLEFATQCKAKFMVCHLGELSYFFRKPDSKLSKFLDSEKSIQELEDDPRFRFIRDAFLELSRKKSAKSYARIIENIENIHSLLEKYSITLGAENRDCPCELPLDWNFEDFLNLTSHLPRISAWHDVGHSKKKELMGLSNQLEFIARTEGSIVGWHLHDCSEEGKDHIAIGSGCIDFPEIAKYFNPQKQIFVLELNKSVRTKDAVDSLKRIQDML